MELYPGAGATNRRRNSECDTGTGAGGPPGSRRDDAIRQAQQALYDTTQSMIQLPPEMRTEKK